MAQTAKPKQQKTHKARLWEAAHALRGNQEPSRYKHVVLEIVFLKYASDRFEARRLDLESSISNPSSNEYFPNEIRWAQFIEDRDEYTSNNVFWVPADARWKAINKYTNRSLTAAEIIAELVKLAMDMKHQAQRHEELGLPEDEAAFYNAIVQNDSSILEMRDDTLKKIAAELVRAVKASATIDWNLKDSVRAAMRSKVSKLLVKYDYPPDHEAKAVELVFEHAELFESLEQA